MDKEGGVKCQQQKKYKKLNSTLREFIVDNADSLAPRRDYNSIQYE